MSVLLVIVALAVAVVTYFLFRGNGNKPRPHALDPSMKVPMKLIDKKVVSHDTRRFRFALPSSSHILGLPIGKHLYVSANAAFLHKPGDEPCKKDSTCKCYVSRPYTPTSSDSEVGFFDLLVKIYFPNVHPKFPDGGKMGQYLESLNIGDYIDVKGPLGRLAYTGCGDFEIKATVDKKMVLRKKHVSEIGMIAGGTGLTPMYQIIVAVLRNKQDSTRISLLYANQTEDDILLRDELDRLAAENPDRFKVAYTLDRPPVGWTQFVGFVSLDMVTKVMPTAGTHSIALLCGPPPMIDFCCKPHLATYGYQDDAIFTF